MLRFLVIKQQPDKEKALSTGEFKVMVDSDSAEDILKQRDGFQRAIPDQLFMIAVIVPHDQLVRPQS